MKSPNIRPAHGFTLIELLVVIAIIAVLASAGFAAGMAALQKARKTTALNAATAIEQAANNFFNEYGYLPSSAATDTVFNTDETAGLDVIKVLLGQETDDANMLNTKSINFLNVREGKIVGETGRDGIIYNDAGVVQGIYDPWRGPYLIAMDLDYNDKINFGSLTPNPKAHQDRTLNSRRVAVWTAGADWAETGGGKGQDDVITW